MIKFAQSPVDYLEQHDILMPSKDENILKSHLEVCLTVAYFKFQALLMRHLFNFDILKNTYRLSYPHPDKQTGIRNA